MKRMVQIGLMLALAAPVGAQYIANSAGTRGAEFLSIDVGARHAALGGTYAADGAGVFTVHGQPAAMGDNARFQVGVQHNEWFGGVKQQFVGIQGPLGEGRWAVTGNLMGVSNLARTTEDATGGFASSNGTFGATDYAVAINYSRRLSNRLSGGVSVKYIKSKIDNVAATTGAVDLGLRWQATDAWTVGASVTNLGPGLKYLRSRADLPWAARLGAAWRNRRWLAAADAVYAGAGNLSAGAGVEYRPADMLALRLGYRLQGQTELSQGLTAGIGVKVESLDVDYAYAQFGPLGGTHRISADYMF